MKIKKRTLLECCQEFCNGRQDEDIENKSNLSKIVYIMI